MFVEKLSVAAEERGTRRNTRCIKELSLANRFARVIFVRNFQSIFANMSQKERIEMSAWLLSSLRLSTPAISQAFLRKDEKKEESKKQRKKEVDFTDGVRVIFFSG